MNIKGVAIKIRSKNGISAKQNINSHYNFLKLNGLVCFSSDIPFARDRSFNELLLYFDNDNGTTFVKCKIHSFTRTKPSGLTPKEFIDENNKKSYFILESMDILNNIENYIVNYDTGEQKKLQEVIKFSRVNRVYYSKEEKKLTKEYILIE